MGIFILFKIATRQKISKRLLQQIEQQIIGQTEVWNGIQISSVYVEVIESLMRFEIRTIILIICWLIFFVHELRAETVWSMTT